MDRRIQERFGKNYAIQDNVVQIGNREFHADILPYVNPLIGQPIDAAGAALYAIADSEKLICFTHMHDPNLRRAYERNHEQAGVIAMEVRKALREFCGPSSDGLISYQLAQAFLATFGITYRDWREALTITH